MWCGLRDRRGGCVGAALEVIAFRWTALGLRAMAVDPGNQAAWTMDNDACFGRESVNVLPRPTVLCTLMFPPARWASSRATVRPRPVPAALRENDRSV